MKLQLGLELRIFHILTGEDIDAVISRFYTIDCAKTKGTIKVLKSSSFLINAPIFPLVNRRFGMALMT